MSMTCINLPVFQATMRKVIEATGKEAADVLNKRSIQVLIGARGYKGAVHFTKKATSAQIKKDLNRKYGVGTQEQITRGKNKGQLKKKITWIQRPTKLLWLLASKEISRQGGGKGLPPAAYRALVANVAERIYRARDNSRAYLAAGWLAAVVSLGHSKRSDSQVKLRPVGGKRIGWASKATKGHLTFRAFNDASSNAKTDAIVDRGLAQAIANQVADMRKYMKDRLNRILKAHSDR